MFSCYFILSSIYILYYGMHACTLQKLQRDPIGDKLNNKPLRSSHNISIPDQSNYQRTTEKLLTQNDKSWKGIWREDLLCDESL